MNCYATLQVLAADLLHDKWHESNCENNATKGCNDFSVANLWCTGSLKPPTSFKSQSKMNPLFGAPEFLQQMS